MSHATVEMPTDLEIPATSLWAKLPGIAGALGLAGTLATLAVGMGEHGQRAMFSWLWAFSFGLSVALGALAWVLIENTTRSGWSSGLRRLGETALVTLPLFVLLWVPIGTFGMHKLYPWTHETDAILEQKRWFLTEKAFYIRAVIYFAVWVFLSMKLYSASVKRDSADAQTKDALTRSLWRVSAPGIILLGLTLSFAAIDWLMSLQPHWYSTIFGIYYFAGSYLAFFAFLTLVSMGLQRGGIMKTAVTTEHFHDLGKYVYGFTVFWAYIAFSQFVLIWYANIPEETEFYAVRMEHGWQAVSYALPLVHFFMPFLFLLSRHMKRRRWTLGLAAAWLLGAHALDLYWLVLPNAGGHGHPAGFAPSWTDITAFVGVVGLFLAAFSFYLKKNKVVAVGDPRFTESLAHENF